MISAYWFPDDSAEVIPDDNAEDRKWWHLQEKGKEGLTGASTLV